MQFLSRNALPLIASVILVSLLIYRSLEDFSYPTSYSISDFPLMSQPDEITCGPTTVAMLLEKYNKHASIEQIKKVARTEIIRWKGRPIGGTSPEYVAEALNAFGVSSSMVAATLEKLKFYVSQDRPCIAFVRSGYTTWHYVVVVGYDEEFIEIADPSGGRRYKLETRKFMGAWTFETDMNGTNMSVRLADIALFLVQTGEAKSQTLIVPTLPIPDA
jgi:ABC-type bacteriocin/lantibiotic exporter with double-glycine peptidase domain